MNIFSRYKTADQAVNGMQTLRKKGSRSLSEKPSRVNPFPGVTFMLRIYSCRVCAFFGAYSPLDIGLPLFYILAPIQSGCHVGFGEENYARPACGEGPVCFGNPLQ
jgi:hypothetical protein